MGWIIALAILILLALIPLGVCVKFDSHGFLARLILGPVRLTVYPAPPKKEKAEKPKKAKSTAKKKEDKPKEEKKSGGKLSDFLPFVETALQFLNDFRRKLRVKRLEMRIIMAGDDPCDLAVNYGRAWTAVGNLMPRLERVLKIKKRDISVECDFTAEKTCIYARVDITITLGRLLCLAVRYGVRALKQYMNLKKGGAENEQ